jgi:ketopantoate reductase
MIRTAIIGAGSLGTILGALMAKCGKQVDLYDSSKEQVEVLNMKGATITGCLELNVPVNAFTTEQLTGQYDIMFLLTKQTSNHIVLPQILPHLHKDGVVCTLQNGIPEEEVASYVGRERTIGAAYLDKLFFLHCSGNSCTGLYWHAGFDPGIYFRVYQAKYILFPITYAHCQVSTNKVLNQRQYTKNLFEN